MSTAANTPNATGAQQKPKALDITSPDELEPLADRILVLPAPAEARKGGIIIPDNGREKPQRGLVLAVGQGAQCSGGCGSVVPMQVQKGDTVLYGKYAGSEIVIEGTTYLLMKEAEVLGRKRSKPAPELPAVPQVN